MFAIIDRVIPKPASQMRYVTRYEATSEDPSGAQSSPKRMAGSQKSVSITCQTILVGSSSSVRGKWPTTVWKVTCHSLFYASGSPGRNTCWTLWRNKVCTPSKIIRVLARVHRSCTQCSSKLFGMPGKPKPKPEAAFEFSGSANSPLSNGVR